MGAAGGVGGCVFAVVEGEVTCRDCRQKRLADEFLRQSIADIEAQMY